MANNLNSSIKIRIINQVFASFLTMLTINACTAQTLSIEDNPGKSLRTTLSEKMQMNIWYDGRRKRTVWLNPSLIAEIQSQSSQQGDLKSKLPDATIKKISQSIIIWQLPEGYSSRSVLSDIGKSDVYSPVFHDKRNENSPLRVLPGNIIVYLNLDWTVKKAVKWLNEHRLTVLTKIEIRPNAFIIEANPGIESLMTANKLYESGGVDAAFPDWWLETVMR